MYCTNKDQITDRLPNKISEFIVFGVKFVYFEYDSLMLKNFHAAVGMSQKKKTTEKCLFFHFFMVFALYTNTLHNCNGVFNLILNDFSSGLLE